MNCFADAKHLKFANFTFHVCYLSLSEWMFGNYYC